MMIKIKCDWCGVEFERDECYLRGKKHHFCSRQCLADFSSKTKNPQGYRELKDYTRIGEHFSDMNRALNPTRMRKETRKKLREAHLGKGECKGYSKIYSKLAHRVVMEKKIGRPLLKEEVVHHRDGNRYNNDPDNLVLFPNVSAHTAFHNSFRAFINELKRLDEENEED